MGKKNGAENPTPSEEKEGFNLLGAPKFKKLDNGRLKCVQTGHELPAHASDAYAQSKHCRLGLIDVALARNKSPLNMFNQDPATRSKLICKLTGDTINKSEEHIWKHINGKRFLNMLEKKEAEKEKPDAMTEMKDEEKEKKNKDKGLKKKIQEEKTPDEIINEVRNSAENEVDFWEPPAGERWDQDDGGDSWGSDSESGPKSDDVVEEGVVTKEVEQEAGRLSKQTKRMSLEIGPSSFASSKKKKKTSHVA